MGIAGRPAVALRDRAATAGSPRPSGLAGEEIGEGDAQDAGEAAQVQDRQVALAPLDGADEGAVQLTAGAQLRLGQVAGPPLLAEAGSGRSVC